MKAFPLIGLLSLTRCLLAVLCVVHLEYGSGKHIETQIDAAHQASLAQLVERGTSNAEVTGSTPLGGSSLM
jgi:hypothetical protein